MAPADDGHAVHYTAVTKGTPVYGSDDVEVGKVVEVLDNYREHIFDGLVIETPDGGRHFVDAPEVARIHERGVVLTLDAREAANLPEPTRNPAAMRADPDDVTPSDLSDKLRRAWDLLSGKY